MLGNVFILALCACVSVIVIGHSQWRRCIVFKSGVARVACPPNSFKRNVEMCIVQSKQPPDRLRSLERIIPPAVLWVIATDQTVSVACIRYRDNENISSPFFLAGESRVRTSVYIVTQIPFVKGPPKLRHDQITALYHSADLHHKKHLLCTSNYPLFSSFPHI
jgi:hypothetical protein